MERKTNILFISLILLSVLIMVFSSSLKSTFIYAVMKAPVYPFIRTIINISDAAEANAEYRIILDRYADEKAVNLLNKETEKENAVLRSMLGLMNKADMDLMPAEIIGSQFGENSRIILNKGTDDGLNVQMPVIFLNGIVGKIVEASPHTSIAETYSNMNFKVGVKNSSETFYSIAGFHSPGMLSVVNLQTDIMLSEGDTLFTSGLGELFPEGLPVGVVSDIKDNYQGEIEYILMPFEEIQPLRFVFVVIKQPSMKLKSDREKYTEEGRIGWFFVMRKKL